MSSDWVADFVSERIAAMKRARPQPDPWLEAAAGVTLFATIGLEAVLRADGSVWLCEESLTEDQATRVWKRASNQEAAGALKQAAHRMPELSRLVPVKRPDQPPCPSCSGSGEFTKEGKVIHGLTCFTCAGVGFLLEAA